MRVVDGNIVDADVDVIVNAWNRNFVPQPLLRVTGVARAIKQAAGREPFVELARMGALDTGTAVATGPGRLAPRVVGIVHAVALNTWWRATPESVTDAAGAAIELARALGAGSVAFPVLGAGAGGLDTNAAFDAMRAAVGGIDDMDVVVVRYR